MYPAGTSRVLEDSNAAAHEYGLSLDADVHTDDSDVFELNLDQVGKMFGHFILWESITSQT